MLEDINGILNSGDVPNLYKTEDMENITPVGQAECISKGLPVTKMNIFQCYLSRVKKNIHMMICMSPLGDIFRQRLRMFPSLVNCCTIDWFTEWPEEALLGVGLGAMNESDTDLTPFTEKCVEMFKTMQKSVEKISVRFLDELRRHNYVTPTSYLELLALYREILSSKRKDITFQRTRLERGLTVLDEAAVTIAALKIEIDRMAPELEETRKEVERTMKELHADQEQADKDKELVQKDEAEAAAQEAEVNELKSAAEFELSKATPLLEEAVKVLRELQPADMVFLKNIGTPTPTMTVGMEVACHFFDCVPKKAAVGKSASDPGGYFETAKAQLLNEPKKFLDRLKSYDREHIPDRVIKKVRPILEGEDFTIAKAEKAATALVGINKWANAMVSYHDLLKIVNPKRQKVKEMKEELEVVRAQLAEKRAYLKSIEEKIEALERKSREKTEFMQSL